MLQLYVVLGLFVVQSIIVGIFLLPRLAPVRILQRALSHILSQNTVRKVFWFVLVALLFLCVEAFQEMRYREREDSKGALGSADKAHHTDVGTALLIKSSMFRAQRNFYLTFFTLALFITMFRLRAIHEDIAQLETANVGKKKD